MHRIAFLAAFLILASTVVAESKSATQPALLTPEATRKQLLNSYRDTLIETATTDSRTSAIIAGIEKKGLSASDLQIVLLTEGRIKEDTILRTVIERYLLELPKLSGDAELEASVVMNALSVKLLSNCLDNIRVQNWAMTRELKKLDEVINRKPR